MKIVIIRLFCIYLVIHYLASLFLMDIARESCMYEKRDLTRYEYWLILLFAPMMVLMLFVMNIVKERGEK